MNRLFQIVGVLTLLSISIYVKHKFKQLAMDNYNLDYSIIGIVINLTLYQLCYWLIEKFARLINLHKKVIYLIGVLMVMFMINGLLSIVFYRYLWLIGIPLIILDPTFLAILIFIISSLIGNYLLNRINVD